MNNHTSSKDKEILELCQQGKKIEAIKIYKEATGNGLKESKEYVEKLASDHGIGFPAGKGGCFIATACYGDYDSTEVLVLRLYRDEKLLKTIPGMVFVKIYYILSPFIAKQLDKSDKLKYFVRTYLLKPLVNRISILNNTQK
jgi:hypothetical protein